ncbi:hypothetical protein BHU72_01905 [Desulfuribacillus stibiiarsenatis]|uniref:Recombinase domain-containing protein n=1 Tax=Desulfuribacillus stibiiarsenatis TaxID=1390249 RepID=A0A1E5L603_9FIRM|nr:hypothetical protein BHU72_01905 [Desulfuribacillus stibiiarsenatis]
MLLQNPVYKGSLVWNRIDSSKKIRTKKDKAEWVVYDDCLPVIIDKEKWEKVQQLVNKRQISPRARSSSHLLSGLLKCPYCKSGMSIGWSGSKNNRYRVYRCSDNKNNGTCINKQYRANELEFAFLNEFIKNQPCQFETLEIFNQAKNYVREILQLINFYSSEKITPDLTLYSNYIKDLKPLFVSLIDSIIIADNNKLNINYRD